MKTENEKFLAMLKTFHSGMLVTQSDQALLGRPMAVAQVEENCDVWFVTSKETRKTNEISQDSHVLVTFQRDNGSYLSLSGTASISADRAKIDQVWKEPFKVWFPEGKNDPTLALIHVQAERGEYWDNSGLNKVSYIFEAVKAYITGTTPTVHEGSQHGGVRL